MEIAGQGSRARRLLPILLDADPHRRGGHVLAPKLLDLRSNPTRSEALGFPPTLPEKAKLKSRNPSGCELRVGRHNCVGTHVPPLFRWFQLSTSAERLARRQDTNQNLEPRSSSRELRISWHQLFFLQSILVGEPSPKKGGEKGTTILVGPREQTKTWSKISAQEIATCTQKRLFTGPCACERLLVQPGT